MWNSGRRRRGTYGDSRSEIHVTELVKGSSWRIQMGKAKRGKDGVGEDWKSCPTLPEFEVGSGYIVDVRLYGGVPITILRQQEMGAYHCPSL